MTYLSPICINAIFEITTHTFLSLGLFDATSSEHLKTISTRLNKLKNNVLEDEQKQYVDALNILVVGPVSVGKTVFINTLARTFGYNWEAVTRTRYNRHGTQEVYKTPLTPQIAIWDTWGVEAQNYQAGTISNIINGHLNEGAKMGNYPDRGHRPQDFISKSMHACIICVDKQATENEFMIDNLRSMFKEMTETQTSYYFVMTKADEVDSSIVDEGLLKNVSEGHLLLTAIERTAAVLGIHRNEISPIASYCSATEPKDDMKSLLCLNILEASIVMAKGKVDRLIRTYPNNKKTTKPKTPYMKFKMVGKEHEVAKKIIIPETYEELLVKVNQILNTQTVRRILNMEKTDELCGIREIIDAINCSNNPNSYCFFVAHEEQETYDMSRFLEVKVLGLNVPSQFINRHNNSIANMLQEASEKFGMNVVGFMDSQQDAQIYELESLEDEQFVFAIFDSSAQSNTSFYQPNYGSSYEM